MTDKSSVYFDTPNLNLPSDAELDKLISSCLGFAGRYAVKTLRQDVADHPIIARSLSTAWSKTKGQIWIRSWSEAGLWGAVGRALAKRPWIQSKISTQEKAISQASLGGYGVSRKVRNMTQTRTTYVNGQATERQQVFLREFEKYRVKVGTRVNSKGKVVPRYKTVYKAKGGYNSNVDTSGLLRFLGNDGQWKSTYGFKLASRPQTEHWDNWMIKSWERTENSVGFISALNTHYERKLEELLLNHNREE